MSDRRLFDASSSPSTVRQQLNGDLGFDRSEFGVARHDASTVSLRNRDTERIRVRQGIPRLDVSSREDQWPICRNDVQRQLVNQPDRP